MNKKITKKVTTIATLIALTSPLLVDTESASAQEINKSGINIDLNDNKNQIKANIKEELKTQNHLSNKEKIKKVLESYDLNKSFETKMINKSSNNNTESITDEIATEVNKANTTDLLNYIDNSDMKLATRSASLVPSYGTSDWMTQYSLMQRFAPPSNPNPNYPFNGGVHYGVDYDLAVGTPVKAVTDGKVRVWSDYNGGNTVTLIEPDGKHYQWYMHLSSFAVSTGQTVKAGQIIGYSGNSGKMTTYRHLHFQRMYGAENNASAIDPLPFLKAIQNRPTSKPVDNGLPERIGRENTVVFKANVTSYNKNEYKRYGSSETGFSFKSTGSSFSTNQLVNIYEIHMGYARVHPQDNTWVKVNTLDNVQYVEKAPSTNIIPDRVSRVYTSAYKGYVTSTDMNKYYRHGSQENGFKFNGTGDTFTPREKVNIYEVHMGYARVHPQDNIWVKVEALKDVEKVK